MRTLSLVHGSLAAAPSKPRRLALSVVLAIATLGSSATLSNAQYGPCQDSWITAYHAWANKDVAASVDGAKGAFYIPSTTHFRTCSTAGSTDDSSSTWVSLEPGSGSSQKDNTMAILQVGVIKCTITSFQVCGGAYPRYFWANGGCLAFVPLPIDLGGATFVTTKTYEINVNGTSYELRIDGALKVTVPMTYDAIDCWVYQDTEATWSVERADRGDSAGSNGATSQRVQVSAARYSTVGSSTWLNPSLSSCINGYDAGAGRYGCTVPSGDAMHVWTSNP